MEKVESQDVREEDDRHGAIVHDLPGDKAAERRLFRKLDLHIIPIIMLLYLFSFLDR